MSLFRVGDSVIPRHLFPRRRSSRAPLNAQARRERDTGRHAALSPLQSARPAHQAVHRAGIGLFRLRGYNQKALLHADCPSVRRLSVFNVCGEEKKKKSTGTVTFFPSSLSYKVTKSYKRGIIELGDIKLFVFYLNFTL